MAYDPLQYVPAAQKAAQTGVEGFAQVAQKPLTQQVGTALGGLNSIGALRSGAVPVALGDIATQYGNQVGGYAKMAAGESLGAGLAANEQALLKQQIDQQRKSSLLGAIGGALGFAANKIFPAKAAVGAASNVVSGV